MSSDDIRDSESKVEPLVAVLVPSYNHEKYVLECLESIKNLNYRRLELIVSDDCSSDSTFALTEEWGKRNAGRFDRILVVQQDKNVGLVRNLQFLFNSAQGDYLAYIASDDVFVESAIVSRLELLQKNLNIDAVFGNAQLISATGSVLKAEAISRRFARELTSIRLLVPSLLLTSFVPGPVMMLRRAAILEGGSLGLLPEDLKTEDWYIYFRMAIAGRLRYVDEVVAKYRVMQSSMSQSPLQYKLMMEALIHVDSIFRRSLTGFNRFLIETRIAKWKLELNKENAAFYKIKKAFWRWLVYQQKTLLFICAIMLRACAIAARKARPI